VIEQSDFIILGSYSTFGVQMISAAIFVLIGLVCGFFLRLPAFIFATCLIVLGYWIAIRGFNSQPSMLIVDLVVALIGLQVGYCVAVMFRLGLERMRRASPQSRRPTISHPTGKE
jgi:hypothetical protein